MLCMCMDMGLCRGIGGVGFSGWGGSLCAGVVLSRDVGLVSWGINFWFCVLISSVFFDGCRWF